MHPDGVRETQVGCARTRAHCACFSAICRLPPQSVARDFLQTDWSAISNHRLAQNSPLSRVKTTLNSGVIREKTQRLEVIQGGLGIHQWVLRTPNDPNPACDKQSHNGLQGRSWNMEILNPLLSRGKTTLNSGVIREKTQRLEVIQSGLGIHLFSLVIILQIYTLQTTPIDPTHANL